MHLERKCLDVYIEGCRSNLFANVFFLSFFKMEILEGQ